MGQGALHVAGASRATPYFNAYALNPSPALGARHESAILTTHWEGRGFSTGPRGPLC